jgi:hypothetical protein
MMYPARPGLIIGFHGCDSMTRNAVVLNETSLYPSTNNYDWLGHGIYFWEFNQKRAIQYAEELQKQVRKSKMPILQPAILGAVIDLGYCLDLLDSEFLEMLRKSYDNLILDYTNRGQKLPENKSPSQSNEKLIRNLDCAVIENVHQLGQELSVKPFDTVRSAFTEGQEVYPTAGFNDKNHIQICVRNPNCIKGYFWPREEDPLWDTP